MPTSREFTRTGYRPFSGVSAGWKVLLGQGEVWARNERTQRQSWSLTEYRSARLASAYSGFSGSAVVKQLCDPEAVPGVWKSGSALVHAAAQRSNSFWTSALSAMPRYFFHVHDSVDIIDDEGSDFTDPDAARAEAVVAAGEMLRDVGGRFWKRPEWRLWVTDETGHTICALRFSAAERP
jgi:hypothetical protein